MRRKRKRSDFRAHFNDEAPRIGSGVRGVNVVKIGRKWVIVRETATGIRARIPRQVFEAIRPPVN